MTIEESGEVENTEQTGQGTEGDDPSWWIDENTPGTGERPDWLGEKFKSAADLAKSYRDLEKRVGMAPESYDFSKSQYLDPDYAPFQELQELAKQKRVPAEVMDKMLESVDKYFSEFTPDYTEEAKLLGEDAPARLKILDNWAKATLSEESVRELQSSLKTAGAIKALEELRAKTMSDATKVPNGNESTENGTTLDDMRNELSNNLEKYKTDSKYRADYQNRLNRVAAANSSFVDKNM